MKKLLQVPVTQFFDQLIYVFIKYLIFGKAVSLRFYCLRQYTFVILFK